MRDEVPVIPGKIEKMGHFFSFDPKSMCTGQKK